MSDIRVAVMQPYFYPYLGYYQMVNAVDAFVFYDDVQFIKGGWINRNRILLNGQPNYITVQLVGASSNKLINEVGVQLNDTNRSKIFKTLEQNYKKAPFFIPAFECITTTLTGNFEHIGQLAAQTVIDVSAYLGLQARFHFSSQLTFSHTASNRTERLLTITKGFNATTYINAAGGKALYQKEEFAEQGIELKFIEPFLKTYPQQAKEFIPGLSIIDVLMHNSKEAVLNMLNDFNLG